MPIANAPGEILAPFPIIPDTNVQPSTVSIIAKILLLVILSLKMVLANYVQAFEGGKVSADNSPLMEKYPAITVNYGDVNGSGRIEIVTAE